MTHPLIEITSVDEAGINSMLNTTQASLSLINTNAESLLTAHTARLKNIITKIKTTLLLNKLVTSEQDSLDCSIFSLNSRQFGLELCVCLCVAVSMCRRKVFYEGWNIFCWPEKKKRFIICLVSCELSLCGDDATMMS